MAGRGRGRDSGYEVGARALRCVAVAGDSAGGNLAAVAAQALRDRVVAQLLVYPVVDLSHDEGNRFPSRVENAEGYFLTADDMRFFERHYLGDMADRRDPRASPLYGDLTGLPPAVVVTAEYDPLRDEGDAYAEAMRAAGVQVEHLRCDGLVHGFVGFAGYARARPARPRQKRCTRACGSSFSSAVRELRQTAAGGFSVIP